MKKSDVIYLAGLFDGEGSVSIVESKQYSLRVSLANSHVETLDWIARTFGGRLYVYDYHKDRRSTSNPETWKPQGVVVWQANTALRLLSLLLPYLRIRKQQAIIGIQFQEGMRRRSKTDGRQSSLPLETRGAFAAEIRGLNARGN